MRSNRLQISREQWTTILIFLLFGTCIGGCFVIWNQPIAFRALIGDRFDSNIWKNWKPGDGDTKIRMLPSLLFNYRLIGMSKSDVMLLLGPPSQDSEEEGSGLIVYSMWTSGALISWDWPYLVIVFENSQVRRVEQVSTFLGDVDGRIIRQE